MSQRENRNRATCAQFETRANFELFPVEERRLDEERERRRGSRGVEDCLEVLVTRDEKAPGRKLASEPIPELGIAVREVDRLHPLSIIFIHAEGIAKASPPA